MPVPLCVSQYLFLQVKHLKSKALTPVEQLGSPHISTLSETGIEDQGISDLSSDQGIADLFSVFPTFHHSFTGSLTNSGLS